MEIRVFLAGVEFGPYTEEKVYQLLDEGTLSLSDKARHEKSADWTRLETVLIEVNAAVETARKAGVPPPPSIPLDLPGLKEDPQLEQVPDLPPLVATVPSEAEIEEIAPSPTSLPDVGESASKPAFFSQPNTEAKDKKGDVEDAKKSKAVEVKAVSPSETPPIIDMAGSFKPGKKKSKASVNLTTLSGRLKALTTRVTIKEPSKLAPPQTHLFPPAEEPEFEVPDTAPVESAGPLPEVTDSKIVDRSSVADPEIEAKEKKVVEIEPVEVKLPPLESPPPAALKAAEKTPTPEKAIVEKPAASPVDEKPSLPLTKAPLSVPESRGAAKALPLPLPKKTESKPLEIPALVIPVEKPKTEEQTATSTPPVVEKELKKPAFLEPVKPVVEEVVSDPEPVAEIPPLPTLSVLAASKSSLETTPVVPRNLMPRTPVKGGGEKAPRTQVPVARKLTEVARPAPLDEPSPKAEKTLAKKASIFPRAEKETIEKVEAKPPEPVVSAPPIEALDAEESDVEVTKAIPIEEVVPVEVKTAEVFPPARELPAKAVETTVIDVPVAKPVEVKKGDQPANPPPSKRIEINLISRKIQPRPDPVAELETPVDPVPLEVVDDPLEPTAENRPSPLDFPVLGAPPLNRKQARKRPRGKPWSRLWQSWMIYSVLVVPALVMGFLFSPMGTRWLQKSVIEATPASDMPPPKWAKPAVTEAPTPATPSVTHPTPVPAPTPQPAAVNPPAPAQPAVVVPNSNATRTTQLVNDGIAKFGRGDLQGAVADYNQALDLNPKLASAYLNRGLAKGSQSDLDGAIADYTQAVQIDPKLAQAFYNRGLARQVKNDLNGATTDYTEALQIDNKMALAYYYRGLIEEQQGNLDAAIADSSKSIDLDPTYAQAFYNRGLARLAKNNINGALADLQQFGTLGTRDVYADYAHVYIWIIQTQQNQLAEANQDLSAALQSGWNADASDLVSKIAQLLLGQISESELISVAASPDALKDQQQRCEAWYFIGMKRLQAGDKIAATSAFQKCVATQETDYCEYILADEELKKLIPAPSGH